MKVQSTARQAAVLVVLLSMLACNLPILATPAANPAPETTLPATVTPLQPGANPPSPAPTTATPAPAYTPVFEPAPCAFNVPGGYDPECGYLIAPENRAHPEARSVRLHVAVFRSRAASPAPEPVVHISGGPGSSALDLAGYMLRTGAGAILDQRDLIIFDQRGTGYSEPRLDCPERDVLSPVLLSDSMISAKSAELIVTAFRDCHDRLAAEGYDLTSYTSTDTAADIYDLARALGYAKIDLYGISYGTRVALTVMRDFPQVVRAAVLDSAYPLQINLYTSLAPNAERAFNVFFDRCAQDSGCASRYPNLSEVFYTLVDRLNENPETVSLNAEGVQRTVRLDGGLLIDVLLVGLYNRGVTETMPEMIYQVQAGEHSILRDRLGLYFGGSTSLGMQMSVQCGEEIPFNTPEDAYTQAEGVQPQIAAFFPASVQPMFAACQFWSRAPLDPRENQPVRSDIPTLILGGQVDPITPPDWGRMVAQDLTGAYFYEIPASGHWVTRSSACAVDLMTAFLRDPQASPGEGCQE